MKLAEDLKTKIGAAEARLTRFRDEMRNDPYECFRWADDSMVAAARLLVYQSVLEALGNGVERDAIRAHALDQTVRRAGHPSHSTLPAQNLLDGYQTQAWAEIIGLLDWHKDSP